MDWEGAKGKPQSSLSQIRPLISFLFSLYMGVLSVVMSVPRVCLVPLEAPGLELCMILSHHVVLGIEPRFYRRVTSVLTNQVICSSSKPFLFLFYLVSDTFNCLFTYE